jgi:hypothetical protein
MNFIPNGDLELTKREDILSATQVNPPSQAGQDVNGDAMTWEHNISKCPTPDT